MFVCEEQEFANDPIIFENPLSGVAFTQDLSLLYSSVLLCFDKYFSSIFIIMLSNITFRQSQHNMLQYSLTFSLICNELFVYSV